MGKFIQPFIFDTSGSTHEVTESHRDEVVQGRDQKNTVTKSSSTEDEENSGKATTIYDYHTRMSAYKDLVGSGCYIEFIRNGEPPLSQRIREFPFKKLPDTLYISEEKLSKRRIWQLAGPRIWDFCRGFPTYLIQEVKNRDTNDIDSTSNDITKSGSRRKRSNTHYFVGRLRGQTQSQYLNFGNSANNSGKAEAESTYGRSVATVVGTNGMGQAQSQSSPLDCDECYRPVKTSEFGPNAITGSAGDGSWPGGITPGETSSTGQQPGSKTGIPSGKLDEGERDRKIYDDKKQTLPNGFPEVPTRTRIPERPAIIPPSDSLRPGYDGDYSRPPGTIDHSQPGSPGHFPETPPFGPGRDGNRGPYARPPHLPIDQGSPGSLSSRPSYPTSGGREIGVHGQLYPSVKDEINGNGQIYSTGSGHSPEMGYPGHQVYPGGANIPGYVHPFPGTYLPGRAYPEQYEGGEKPSVSAEVYPSAKDTSRGHPYPSLEDGKIIVPDQNYPRRTDISTGQHPGYQVTYPGPNIPRRGDVYPTISDVPRETHPSGVHSVLPYGEGVHTGRFSGQFSGVFDINGHQTAQETGPGYTMPASPPSPHPTQPTAVTEQGHTGYGGRHYGSVAGPADLVQTQYPPEVGTYPGRYQPGTPQVPEAESWPERFHSGTSHRGEYGPNGYPLGSVGAYPQQARGAGTYPEQYGGTGTHPQQPGEVDTYPQLPAQSHTYPQQPTGAGPYPQQPSGVDIYPQKPSGAGTYPEQPGGFGAYPQEILRPGSFPQQPGELGTYPKQSGGSDPYPHKASEPDSHPHQPSRVGIYPQQPKQPVGPGAYPQQPSGVGIYPQQPGQPVGPDTYPSQPSGAATYPQEPGHRGIPGTYPQQPGGDSTYPQQPGQRVGSGRHPQQPFGAGTYPQQVGQPGGPGQYSQQPSEAGTYPQHPQQPTGAGIYPQQPRQPVRPGTYPQQPGGPDTYPHQPSGSETYPHQPSGSGTYPQQPSGTATYPQQPGQSGGSSTRPHQPRRPGTYPQQPSGTSTYPQQPGQSGGSGTYPQQPSGTSTYPQQPGQSGGSGTHPHQPRGPGTYPQQPSGTGTYPQQPGQSGGSGTYPQQPSGTSTYPQQPGQPGGPDTYPQQPSGAGAFPHQTVGPGSYPQQPGGDSSYPQLPSGGGMYPQRPEQPSDRIYPTRDHPEYQPGTAAGQYQPINIYQKKPKIGTDGQTIAVLNVDQTKLEEGSVKRTGIEASEIPGQSDDSDSQAQTSIQQMNNGTQANAQAQGRYESGMAQSQVSGTYSGSGSFSASAGSDDGKKGVLTQVSGGKKGAESNAQGHGGKGRSQAQTQFFSDTGKILSSAQSGGLSYTSQTQVQGGEEGGMANAQSNGSGPTSSQAQIGFSPHKKNVENDGQENPFLGSGMASAQGGSTFGQSESQIRGKFSYGIKYSGGAQSQTGGGPKKPFTFIPFNTSLQNQFNAIKPTNLQSQKFTSSLEDTENSSTNANSKKGRPVESEEMSNKATTQIPSMNKDGDQGENEEYYDYDEHETEIPSTNKIITQTRDGQTQHIVLPNMRNLDATVLQTPSGSLHKESLQPGRIFQPGELIPGTSGYRIPPGFRGKIRAVASPSETYALGRHSQAQSVTITPGTGKISYNKLKSYRRSSQTYEPHRYYFRSGEESSIPGFLSISKSETGYDNPKTGKKAYSTHYTQSSTCGFITHTCVFRNNKRICIPNMAHAADGTGRIC